MFLLDTQTYGRTDRREGPPLALTADFTSKLPREMERQGGGGKGVQEEKEEVACLSV